LISTESDVRRLPTIIETMRWRASHEADRIAVSFLAVDESPTRWTCAELDRRARIVASALQQQNIQRALLLYPQGLDFVAAILGCFYAGCVAVRAPVPRPNRSGRRVESILREAKPSAILCNASVAAQRASLAELAPASAEVTWIDSDTLSPELAGEWEAPSVLPKDVAFLQYTSGSTSDPRGVMVGHGNLVANSHYIAKRFEHSSASHFLSWLPHFHDMGLIGGILHPLHWGFSCTLLDPLETMQKPVRWLRAIAEQGATTSGAPNFAYEACARRVSPEDRDALDLSRWDVAFNGAEPVSAITIEHFSEFFAPSGFRPEAFFPCYGLAEATLFVTGGPKKSRPRFHSALRPDFGSKKGRERLVSCGLAGPDTEVAIVDLEQDDRVEPGAIGEVWIAGPSIPSGYLHNPVEGSGTFGAHLPDSDADYFRTGDLGFIEDGQLYITGRIKDIVIVAGVNYAAEDLERSIEDAHRWLTPGRCAAFAIEKEGSEELAVAVEVAREHWRSIAASERPASPRRWKRVAGKARDTAGDTETKRREIEAAIRSAISKEHGITARVIAILPPSRLPRTSSGKVQRHACRAEYEAGSLLEARWRRKASEDRPDARSAAHTSEGG
jgi:acyl-CoA synthetase (AMP-forming)/AMP-acid ligase II